MDNVKTDLDRMIWAYEAFVLTCKYSFNNPKTIKELCLEQQEKEIFNIAHRAFQEVKSMAFSDHSKLEIIAGYYLQKCSEILEVHDSNIKEFDLHHWEKLSMSIKYFNIIDPLLKFQHEVWALLPILREKEKRELKNIPYSPSQFNQFTYQLFCHIIKHYNKNGKRKYTNIWFFLRDDISKKKDDNLLFNFIQDEYKKFIWDQYKVELKKFNKAEAKYERDEVKILQNIVNNFRELLKEDENP